MVLTVGDIRKALEKYSDDTIVLDKLSENAPSMMPILKDSFSLRGINVDELKNIVDGLQNAQKKSSLEFVCLHLGFEPHITMLISLV